MDKSSEKRAATDVTTPTESFKRKQANFKGNLIKYGHQMLIPCIADDKEGSFSKKVSENGSSTITKAMIDLSTPERAARDNTASTTPHSTSSGSASARRTREMRMKKKQPEPKIEQDPAKEEVKPEEEVKVVPVVKETPKQSAPKPKKAKVQEPKKSKDITSVDQLSLIIIKIYYKTIPKQDLFIIGEDEKFGNWSTTNLVFPLTWTDGHQWIAVKKPNELPNYSKFKFIVSEVDDSIT